MSYSFWRPPTLAPGGACPPLPPSYATASTVTTQIKHHNPYYISYYTLLHYSRAYTALNCITINFNEYEFIK